MWLRANRKETVAVRVGVLIEGAVDAKRPVKQAEVGNGQGIQGNEIHYLDADTYDYRAGGHTRFTPVRLYGLLS